MDERRRRQRRQQPRGIVGEAARRRLIAPIGKAPLGADQRDEIKPEIALAVARDEAGVDAAVAQELDHTVRQGVFADAREILHRAGAAQEMREIP